MKKRILLTLIAIIGGAATFADTMTTEKDIGSCIARNTYGFCVESKTHYCASVVKDTGKCNIWFSKSKSDFDNAQEQFNAFNKDIQNAINKNTSTKDITIRNNAKNKVSIDDTIYETRQKFIQEADSYKRKAGFGIDEKNNIEMAKLLESKAQMLQELKKGSEYLISGYENSFKAYENKQLSEEEYKQVLSKLDIKNQKIEKIYNQILNITENTSDYAYEKINQNIWIVSLMGDAMRGASDYPSETWDLNEKIPEAVKAKIDNVLNSNGAMKIRNFLQR